MPLDFVPARPMVRTAPLVVQALASILTLTTPRKASVASSLQVAGAAQHVDDGGRHDP